MIEVTGRTRDEAVAEALRRLGIARGEAEVRVLEEKPKRFFGLFGGPSVRVRVMKREVGAADPRGDAERVREIVEGILGAMSVPARVSVGGAKADPCVEIETEGADGLLIGRQGQTLLALQHVANRILTRCRDNRPIVTVDVGGYRSRQPEIEEPTEEAERGGRENGRRRSSSGPRRAKARAEAN